MRDLPVPPYHLVLNTTMQTIATVVLWAGTIALLAYAYRLARQERSPFPLLLVLAVAAGSLIEPLYDIAYHLFRLDHGQQWTLFTAFGLPQPVWVMPAYVVVFALPALLLYRRLRAGAAVSLAFTFALVLTLTTAVFEIIAVNVDLYTYYGQAPVRVFGYPLWIGFMEGVQIATYAVLAAVLRHRATRPVHGVALFVLFPANFAWTTLGAGFPTLMAINTPDPSTFVMWLSVPISVAFSATSLWLATQLLMRQRQSMGDHTAAALATAGFQNHEVLAGIERPEPGDAVLDGHHQIGPVDEGDPGRSEPAAPISTDGHGGHRDRI